MDSEYVVGVKYTENTFNRKGYCFSDAQKFKDMGLNAPSCSSCNTVCTQSIKDIKFLDEVLRGE